MTADTVIAAVGGRTSLGPSIRAAWLALTAGLSGVRGHPFMVDANGDRVMGGCDPEVDPVLPLAGRLLAFISGALDDLENGTAGWMSTGSIPVLCALPESRPGFDDREADQVKAGLEKLSFCGARLRDIRISNGGHAVGVVALNSASELIAKQDCDAVLVIGADSYFQADTIDWLEQHRQLANATSRSVFVPGEGAGACLVMSAGVARQSGIPALMPILAGSLAQETKLIKSTDTCLGEGLSDAVSQIADCLHEDDRINAVISDQNGERYRSDEWGFMALRHGAKFDDVTDYLAPAIFWGDVGAASGPLFAALAFEECAAFPSERTLIVASSEGGARATVLLGSRIEIRKPS